MRRRDGLRSPGVDARTPGVGARTPGDGRLSGYHYLPAVKADLLSRIGRTGEAADSYRQAFDLAANEAERAFLAEQIADHTHRA